MNSNPGSTATDGAPPSVFISYRREDTSAHAGRLYDAMVARFGERHVFMDVDMAPGVDFVARITEAVSGCLVLIVVMGPKWATVADEDGTARIADPEDFVRLEVETALRRDEVTPIPVLVSGARMPRRDELPLELQQITHRNALELSDMRWSYDVDRLNATLDVLLADTIETTPATPVVEPPTPEPPVAVPSPTDRGAAEAPGPRLALEGMLVAAVTAFVARIAGQQLSEEGGTRSEKAVSAIVTRTETWALVGAAILIWLAARTGRRDLGRTGLLGLTVGALAGLVGGVIWAVPVHLLLEVPVTTLESSWIQVGSLAFTGGLLGGLIGALWQPRRRALGFVCGAAGGALSQVGVIAIDWDTSRPPSAVALAMAISAAAIVGLTLAVLRQPHW